jgi:hypothetical protein
MVTITILIAALAGARIAVWGWREVAHVNQRLGGLDGFEGMHFES